MNLTAEQLLASPAVSHWLKSSLESALHRDPLDAAKDASLLADVLNARADTKIAQDITRLGLRVQGT
jgi:hypothetical protein